MSVCMSVCLSVCLSATCVVLSVIYDVMHNLYCMFMITDESKAYTVYGRIVYANRGDDCCSLFDNYTEVWAGAVCLARSFEDAYWYSNKILEGVDCGPHHCQPR